jgi:hypothetical protein
MKKYKVDKTKIIGNVVFVVEGGRPESGGTELRLLKSIFADVLGYDLFQYKKRFEFDYSSPYKKIIIMNSMPRKVLLNWENKQIPLESGDRFGEYILYTETEFLNALNRDVLGR